MKRRPLLIWAAAAVAVSARSDADADAANATLAARVQAAEELIETLTIPNHIIFTYRDLLLLAPNAPAEADSSMNSVFPLGGSGNRAISERHRQQWGRGVVAHDGATFRPVRSLSPADRLIAQNAIATIDAHRNSSLGRPTVFFYDDIL